MVTLYIRNEAQNTESSRYKSQNELDSKPMCTSIGNFQSTALSDCIVDYKTYSILHSECQSSIKAFSTFRNLQDA